MNAESSSEPVDGLLGHVWAKEPDGSVDTMAWEDLNGEEELYGPRCIVCGFGFPWPLRDDYGVSIQKCTVQITAKA